jgi:hypothetical protein
MGTHKKMRQPSGVESWCDQSPESVIPEFVRPSRNLFYGLPCAHCKAYYDSELQACPVCGCTERVSPSAVHVPVRQKLRAA